MVVPVLLLAACSTNPDVLAAYISPDGVTIELGVDTCNADLTAEVVESDTAVEITVFAENDTTDDCIDGIVITLGEPLGDRVLVNGSTGGILRVIHGEGAAVEGANGLQAAVACAVNRYRMGARQHESQDRGGDTLSLDPPRRTAAVTPKRRGIRAALWRHHG